MIARGIAGGREPVGLFFAIDLVVHLLLKWVVCCNKKGNIHTEDTTSHGEKKTEKKRKKKESSTGIELANFDWMV